MHNATILNVCRPRFFYIAAHGSKTRYWESPQTLNGVSQSRSRGRSLITSHSFESCELEQGSNRCQAGCPNLVVEGVSFRWKIADLISNSCETDLHSSTSSFPPSSLHPTCVVVCFQTTQCVSLLLAADLCLPEQYKATLALTQHWHKRATLWCNFILCCPAEARNQRSTWVAISQ